MSRARTLADSADLNFDSGTLVIDETNNRVGIGTSAPSDELHIEDSNNTVQARLEATTGSLYVGVGGNAGYLNTTTSEGIRIRDTGTDLASFREDGSFQFNSGFGSVGTAYGCRAWVKFDGTGTVTIRASGNVSSIDDNDTGNYTVNFTNSMPDANFAAVASTAGTTSSGNNSTTVGGDYSHTTTYFSFKTRHVADYANDCNSINAAVFR